MTSHRPFRFGVQADNASSAAEWTALARKVESLGYSTLTMPDHFGNQFAPMPALMAAAAVTTTLRVGALVFDNDYKHPVVLAKELATMDVLSEGRVEIGVGAGWMVSDYEQSGIAYDRPGVRIDRFVEGLEIIRRAMLPGPFDFSGAHYTIRGYDGLPKPLQTPPPLLIGGGGPRVLGIAAKWADIVGINPSMHAGKIDAAVIHGMTAASVDEKLAVLTAAAGERMGDIELSIRAFLVDVADEAASAQAAMASFFGVDPGVIASSPYALVGPPAELADLLVERRERWGFSYVVVGGADVEAFAPVVARLAGT